MAEAQPVFRRSPVRPLRLVAALRRGLAVIAAVAVATTGVAVSAADSAPEGVRVVTELPKSGADAQYVTSRAPLAPSPLLKLPIGRIIPRGWLRKQLELEAEGMCGRLPEVSAWCKFDGNAWTDPKGQGKNGWEEVPYWIKGYGDLAYVLKSPPLLAESKRWLDAIFAAQSADGYFGPQLGRTSLNGKPDLWPQMPVLNALQSYYEFSGDSRVIDLMTRYFKYQLNLPESDLFTGYWDKMRTGDNLESVHWLYNRTGEPWLLELAARIHQHSADWVHKVPNWHNVNLAQGFREPAEYSIQAKDPALYAATVRVYDTVMGTYGQVPGGGFGGDENCRPGFVDPRQGFETCGIVEFMHSFQMLARLSGDPLWADRCEELAFNSLPAALTPDLKALHYLTSPNQVQLDKNNKSPGIQNGGTMFAYSPGGVYRCCQHNHGMGWPYYAEELWHATLDGGLEASLYCACTLDAKVRGGSTVTIEETTDYPFSETVTLKVTAFDGKPQNGAPARRFPLYLRVPRWCEKASVAVNGTAQPADAKPLSYLVLDRAWSEGDTVTLTLPMRLAVRTWAKNKNAVSVDFGPLTFSLQIGQKWVKYGGDEKWPEYEVYPTTPWNYGLVLGGADPTASFEVVRKEGPVADQPFTPEASPITLTARARKIPAWRADTRELIRPLQASPAKSEEPVESVTLIPMGAARLRISAFPVIGEGPSAHEWAAPAAKAAGLAGQATARASHVFESDTVDALNDGEVPSSSSDDTIPRLTWWDHRGTSEWVEYDFERPAEVSGVSVYWFDDTGRGQCRAPQSWRVLYRAEAGGEWKPVEPAGAAAEYGTKLDAFNRVTFTPVKAAALRVEAKLQAGFSGGILEWQVE